MKLRQPKKLSVLTSMLKKVTEQQTLNSKDPKQNPTVESKPLEPAELDQDPGAGYNPDHTFPQS